MVWLAKATTTKKENCHGQEGTEGPGGDKERNRSEPGADQRASERTGAPVGRGDLERAVGRGGGSAVPIQSLPTGCGSGGHAGRALRTGAADASRRGGLEGAQAAYAAVRDADHRAVSAAGKLGR